MRLFLFLLLLLTFQAFSQNVNADIQQLLKQNEDYREFIESEMPSNEIETNKIEGNDQSIDSLYKIQDIDEDKIQDIDEGEKTSIFGFDYINSIPKSISSTSDLPVPNNYLLSLGDKLNIIYTGSRRDSFSLTIGMDGVVLFPEIGEINLFGDTFAEAKKKIKALVEVYYVGVQVSVSLQELAAKKINIVGAVNNPGTYIVNPFTTITSALAYSGGFIESASLRNILLIRSNKVITFDLYDLLIYGNRESDLNIEQGDTLLINSTNKLLDVKGAVKRPLKYEYTDEESVNDLILYALGFSKTANKKNIAITYLDEGLDRTRVAEVSYDDEVLLKGLYNPLSIEIFNVESSPEMAVKVTGPLENQGYFDIPTSKKLPDLLKNLKLTELIYPYLAVVQEGNYSKLFSLQDNSTQDIELERNYEIIFFNKNSNILENPALSENSKSLISDYLLKVYDGQERELPIFGQISALDVINFYGIDTSNIEENMTTYVNPIQDEVLVGSFKDIQFTASKFNSLSFRRQNSDTIKVTVQGEVSLPGTYTLSSSTSLYDLYKLIGDLKPSAESSLVILERESVRQRNIQSAKLATKELNDVLLSLASNGIEVDFSIFNLAQQKISDQSGRVSGNFALTNVDIISKFILEDGDSIFVPKKLSTFSVLGQVLNSSTHLYSEGMNLNKAIQIAGGFKVTADKRLVYVIRSDGTVEIPSRKFLGLGLGRKNIKIFPGDTVIVPRELDLGPEFLDRVVPLTSILSNLAFSAAALDNIKQ